MLGDFFRINLPYGLKRIDTGAWYAFNREYMPLGFNNQDYKSTFQTLDLPIYTHYKRLTETLLKSIAWNDSDGIRRDQEGAINMVFLYNDSNNPTSQPKYWNDYFDKLKILSSLKEK